MNFHLLYSDKKKKSNENETSKSFLMKQRTKLKTIKNFLLSMNVDLTFGVLINSEPENTMTIHNYMLKIS